MRRHAFLTHPGATPSAALAEHGPPQGEPRREAEASAEPHPRPPGPQSATSSCARAPRIHLHPSSRGTRRELRRCHGAVLRYPPRAAPRPLGKTLVLATVTLAPWGA